MPVKESDWPELYQREVSFRINKDRWKSQRLYRNDNANHRQPGRGDSANAISAAVEDPRFMPMNLEELSECDMSVDVLGSPQRCSREVLWN